MARGLFSANDGAWERPAPQGETARVRAQTDVQRARRGGGRRFALCGGKRYSGARAVSAADLLNSRPSATGLTASPLTNRCGSAAERRAPSPPSVSAPPTRQSGSAGFRRRSRPVIMPHHADYLPVLPRPPVRTPSLLQLSAVRYLTNMPCAMRWPCAMRYGSAPRLNRRMPMLPSFWGLE